MARIPIPLIIAAIVATTAVVIYLNMTIVAAPPVVDPNFTGTLVAGSIYQWRGAAGQITFKPNATIDIAYIPVGYVVYANSGLTNMTLGDNVWIVVHYGNPYLVTKVWDTNGVFYFLTFKLANIANVSGVRIYVPDSVSESEITEGLTNAIHRVTGGGMPDYYKYHTFNSTHIIFTTKRYAVSIDTKIVVNMPPFTAVDTSGQTFNFNGVGFARDNATGYVTPYMHFFIRPRVSTSIVILVR